MPRYNKYDKLGDIHWKSYNAGRGRYYELVNESLKLFKNIKGGTLLDVGCGDGVSSCLLSIMGFDVTGVDIEQKGIEFAKLNCLSNVNWICEDISDFIKRGEYFDYLYSLNTIEHLENPEVMIDLMKFINKFAIIITDNAEVKSKKGRYHSIEYTRKSFCECYNRFKVEEIPLLDQRYLCFKIIK